MEYDKLKEKVNMLGFRVTKDVKGKRVKLTKKELAAKLPKKMKAQPSLENQAKSAKKFIKKFGINHCHDSIFWSSLAISHEVTKCCVAVVAHGLVKRDRSCEAVKFGIAGIEGLAVA